MTPVVAVVLRSGGDFQPEHVARLVGQLRKVGKWDGHIVCLTDVGGEWPPEIEVLPLTYGWPGWWSKLELCAPTWAALGDILYFDLDTTIVGSIHDLANVRRPALLQDFLRPTRRNSGIMYLTEEVRRVVWSQWTTDPKGHRKTHGRRGDGSFYNWALGSRVESLQDLVPGQIVSFKEHVRIAGYIVPDEARVVCFHGHPRPWEVVGWHWSEPDQKHG